MIVDLGNVLVLGSENEKLRVRKSTEVLGSAERKRLANITNMQQPRMSMLDEKSQFVPASTKEYIDKLKKVLVLWPLMFSVKILLCGLYSLSLD